jgi:transcriptional regulator with XRE-family HTH domain
VAEQIKALRIAAGKTRAQVAADLDISERHLHRLETSEEPLERRWVLAFAAYYDVPPEEIENGDGVAA